MATIETLRTALVWCQCCSDAGCPDHMDHVDSTTECVVCHQPCQCVGCAANAEPGDEPTGAARPD